MSYRIPEISKNWFCIWFYQTRPGRWMLSIKKGQPELSRRYFLKEFAIKPSAKLVKINRIVFYRPIVMKFGNYEVWRQFNLIKINRNLAFATLFYGISNEIILYDKTIWICKFKILRYCLPFFKIMRYSIIMAERGKCFSISIKSYQKKNVGMGISFYSLNICARFCCRWWRLPSSASPLEKVYVEQWKWPLIGLSLWIIKWSIWLDSF